MGRRSFAGVGPGSDDGIMVWLLIPLSHMKWMFAAGLLYLTAAVDIMMYAYTRLLILRGCKLVPQACTGAVRGDVLPCQYFTYYPYR